ncbi:MAG: hypothetical protein RL043_1310, partial [Pseudomonadota bacterium]
MKIDQSKLPSQTNGAQSPAVKSQVDSMRANANQQASTTPQSKPAPAANVDISSASASAAQAAKEALRGEKPLDTELLDKIRERIASGDFQIDYDK